YGWAILIILVVLAVLWYYGVFDPSRYAGETRTCPANFLIQASPLSVSNASAGTGTLTMVVANAAGHQVTVSNVTLGGDVAGSLSSGNGVINAGDTRNLVASVTSGLTGSTGTLVNINAAIAFTHSATGYNNLAETTTCNLKLKIP
ncbi:hypothetical protein HYS54_02195, partial [Candidatus Micrarchaeota archaeon]|nr:hypothetical protein [Candidatus Micrarchaeota archaeon]